jgi:uncharacterized membrane protein
MSDTGRLETFSDAVLAIAITLLVLNLKIPEDPTGSLAAALAEQWPSYLAYLVSFMVIGIIWLNHHAMFRLIARVDRTVLLLNLTLLLIVAAIPFPTALLAAYLSAGRDSHTAAAVYSGTMLAMAVAFLAMWRYVTGRERMLHEHLDRTAARATSRRFGVGLLIYVATIGLSFVNATATLVAHLVIALYYCFDQLSMREPRSGDDLAPLAGGGGDPREEGLG